MGGYFAYDGGEAGVLAFCQAAYYVAEEISVNMVFVCRRPAYLVPDHVLGGLAVGEDVFILVKF